jgi:hypothetical protein
MCFAKHEKLAQTNSLADFKILRVAKQSVTIDLFGDDLVPIPV